MATKIYQSQYKFFKRAYDLDKDLWTEFKDNPIIKQVGRRIKKDYPNGKVLDIGLSDITSKHGRKFVFDDRQHKSAALRYTTRHNIQPGGIIGHDDHFGLYPYRNGKIPLVKVKRRTAGGADRYIAA